MDLLEKELAIWLKEILYFETELRLTIFLVIFKIIFSLQSQVVANLFIFLLEWLFISLEKIGEKATEIIIERVDEYAINMGLNPGVRVTVTNILISKNYLNDQELTELNRLNWDFDNLMRNWNRFQTKETLFENIQLTLQEIKGFDEPPSQFFYNMTDAKIKARHQLNLYRRRKRRFLHKRFHWFLLDKGIFLL